MNFGEEPATGETVFDIGSITKVFTGVALSHAIVEEDLTPDTSICKLDRELFGEGNALCAITVSEVATHRSGLPRLPTNLNPLLNMRNPYANYSEEELQEFVQEWDGYTKKAHPYLYSNIGTGLLGHLLVKRAGARDYDALLKEVLLQELDMKSTSTNILMPEDERKIQGYDLMGFESSEWTGETLAGMGLLRSNVHDMLKFLDAYINLPETSDQDSTPLQETLRLSMMPLRSLRAASPDSIAYFWHIHQVEEGKRYWWHNGMTGGYTSFMAFDPEHRGGVVALFNQSHQEFTTRWMRVLNALWY